MILAADWSIAVGYWTVSPLSMLYPTLKLRLPLSMIYPTLKLRLPLSMLYPTLKLRLKKIKLKSKKNLKKNFKF